MNIENELKLIPKKDIKYEQLMDILRKNGMMCSETGKIAHQEDTYFDDQEGTLEKIGGSFRIRRKNDKTKVTYKVPIKSETQYKQRKEYEITVPDEYKHDINMELAIKLLKQEYPELKFPENMGEILTVINDRKKNNLTCTDGTVVEMAFDTLQGKDEKGDLYKIQPEIEFETISGNPENLSDIYEIVTEEFPDQLQKNTLSKYERTKKEMKERKLTLGEISACAILSEILNSVEYSKLQQKGQILHRYEKPTTTNLDNFKNFDYLVDILGKIKRGQYKVQISKAIAEKSDLLKNENYEVKDSINLEEMVCLLLSNVKYKVADESLVDFLNKNYYGEQSPVTNRLSHSQQIMLGSGLIAKSSEVGANFEEKLDCMISGLSHDIGHVPMAHTLEGILNIMDGLFSHELNGKITIENILEQSKSQMILNIKKYFPQLSDKDIQEAIERKAIKIEDAVVNHSRKGSDRRSEGVCNQAARATDKICYVASDICDLKRYGKNILGRDIDVLDKEWLSNAVLKICNENEDLANDVGEMLEKKYISYLRDENYGRAVVNAINSIEGIELGEMVYYEVNPKIWSFIDKLIGRVKDVRENMEIEQAKNEMSKTAIGFIVEELYKEYSQNNGNIELAWENLLKRITQMGELDILNYLVEKNKLVLFEQLKDKEKISPEEAGQIINVMSERVYEISKIKGKTDEEAKKSSEGIKRDLAQLTPEQVLQYFKKYKFIKEIPIEPIIEQLHNKADIQLKMNPGYYGFLDGVWEDLRIDSDGHYKRINIVDQYYQIKNDENNQDGISVKVRTKEEKNVSQLGKTLIVKVPVKKNVSERMTKKYVVQGEANSSVEDLMEQLANENPGLNIELASNEPYKNINIIRKEYKEKYGADEVIFTEDNFKEPNGTMMSEIEIKCPSNPKVVAKIKSKLKGKYKQYFIKDSKIDRVQGENLNK